MDYSKKQVLRFCVMTAVLTAVAGFAFVETAYPTVRQSLKSLVQGEEATTATGRTGSGRWTPEEIAAARGGSLEFPRAQAVQREKTQEILARRDTELTLEEQHQLMTLWHDLSVWQNMWYLGIRIQKNPMDLWQMQQILQDVKPDYVIETGTLFGGSALYWAHILDGLGLEDSKVITIDIEDRQWEASQHPLWQKYVEFVHTSSTDPETIEMIRQRTEGKKVVVVLDALHTAPHVLEELKAYGPMVSPGSYIVAEDTNMDGIPVQPSIGDGPMTAVLEYMEGEGAELFEQDITRENFILTFNPGGWLKRKGQ